MPKGFPGGDHDQNEQNIFNGQILGYNEDGLGILSLLA